MGLVHRLVYCTNYCITGARIPTVPKVINLVTLGSPTKIVRFPGCSELSKADKPLLNNALEAFKIQRQMLSCWAIRHL